MKIHYIIPYSLEKNLGKAYNEAMAMIPDGDAVCFTDGDAMYTRPDFGHAIYEYATRNPNAVLTCWINRIHPLATGQHLKEVGDSVEACLKCARGLAGLDYSTEPITGSVSGTLMVVHKHIWKQVPFTETNRYRAGESNMLGVDNAFTNDVRKAGFEVLRMNTILIYHQYRLLTGTKDHLL